MAARGLDVVGVDISQAMLSLARSAHPHVKFEEGQLDALPFEMGVFAGAVCWYSIIYTPPESLAETFGELARVLIPGGYVLLAFRRRMTRYKAQMRTVHTCRSPATGIACKTLPIA